MDLSSNHGVAVGWVASLLFLFQPWVHAGSYPACLTCEFFPPLCSLLTPSRSLRSRMPPTGPLSPHQRFVFHGCIWEKEMWKHQESAPPEHSYPHCRVTYRPCRPGSFSSTTVVTQQEIHFSGSEVKVPKFIYHPVLFTHKTSLKSWAAAVS